MKERTQNEANLNWINALNDHWVEIIHQNSSWEVINPATEEKQALGIVELEKINTVNFATQAKQDEIIANQTNATQKTQIFWLNPNNLEVEEIWKDAISWSIVQIEISHAAIHLGKYFSHSWLESIANGASFDHLIVTPSLWWKMIHLRVFLFDTTSAPIQHTLYEDGVVSNNWTQIVWQNFNRNWANATMWLYHTPTITTIGNEINTTQITWTKQIWWSWQTSWTEWVLKEGSNYISRITNNSWGIASVGYIAEWYEL